jgi:hypothetical protein
LLRVGLVGAVMVIPHLTKAAVAAVVLGVLELVLAYLLLLERVTQLLLGRVERVGLELQLPQ